MATTASSIWVQLISATIGTLGFAMIFRLHGKNLFCAAVGALLTWGVYLAAFDAFAVPSYNRTKFIAAFTASVAVAFYAQVMARVNKAPATVFLASSAFPLIPGSNLYYMMYDIVMGDMAGFENNGITLIVTCLAMAFGFTIVETLNKYVFMAIEGVRKK